MNSDKLENIPMYMRVPSEILENIIAMVDSQQTLKEVALASKKCCAGAQRIIFEVMSLSAEFPHARWSSSEPPFFRDAKQHFLDHPITLTHVRKLQVHVGRKMDVNSVGWVLSHLDNLRFVDLLADEKYSWAKQRAKPISML
ncbi:hypothetical protein B0H19DRAFT_1240813, partial [Mycena capillaripes]